MDILRLAKTDTTKFILPLLFNEDTKYPEIITDDFKNAYIADIDDQSKDGHILLVYTEVTYTQCKEVYEKGDLFIHVFSIPEEFIEDYYKFLSGKYSEFSEQTKQRILSFWDEDDDSLLHGILYKTKVAKDYWEEKYSENTDKWSNEAELWIEPNMRKEILGYETHQTQMEENEK